MKPAYFAFLLLGLLFSTPALALVVDTDGDGVPDVSDVWPNDNRYSTDSDADGLPDAWELYQFGTLTASDAVSDADGDGFSDLVEFGRGSDPQVAETVRAQAERRIPPMIETLTMPENMAAESTYTIDWTVMGYGSAYSIYMVLFDCTGISPGSCGDRYSSNFYSVKLAAPNLTEPAPWSYNGEVANYFHYSTTYTVPATRADGVTAWPAAGTPVVVRFYQKSSAPADAGKNSISLLMPGNITNTYYDSTGRRIQKQFCPAGGCN